MIRVEKQKRNWTTKSSNHIKITTNTNSSSEWSERTIAYQCGEIVLVVNGEYCIREEALLLDRWLRVQ